MLIVAIRSLSDSGSSSKCFSLYSGVEIGVDNSMSRARKGVNGERQESTEGMPESYTFLRYCELLRFLAFLQIKLLRTVQGTIVGQRTCGGITFLRENRQTDTPAVHHGVHKQVTSRTFLGTE